MRLLFKQRMFSWFDSYDIYDESGNTVFVVKGQLAWGHCLKVFDSQGREIGMLQQKIFSFLPRFEIYVLGEFRGCITKQFSFFKPVFNIEYNGWYVEGSFWEWDYQIFDVMGKSVATVSKEFGWTDTYVIDVVEQKNVLMALMLVLAIDAEKCSRN